MTWHRDPQTWKPSSRLLLGIATIWPIVYIILFVGAAVSGVFIVAPFNDPMSEHRSYLDLIQLEKKIQNGEIKELRISSYDFEAVDRDGRSFRAFVYTESTRAELIRQALELRADGRARVDKIDERSATREDNPALPFAFLVLMGLHLLTMILLISLMPVYIILPLKNPLLDRNMRIVWVILACTVGVFSDAVYWYLYVRRTRLASPPPAPEFT